jgi:pimeloyl-ACP methyl ester carboxylesterase
VLAYLHGFASGPASAKARIVAERFAQLGVHVERPDLTPGDEGFERSTPLSMLAVAEQTLAHGIPPHAMLGSSLGGYLAAVTASRDPSVQRLVLLAPAFRLAGRWREAMGPEALAAWKKDGFETFHHTAGRTRRIDYAFLEGADQLPAFPQVSVPTLCIAAARDTLVLLSDVERFVAQTPQARLLVLDDTHDLTAFIDRIWDEARAFLAPFTGV